MLSYLWRRRLQRFMGYRRTPLAPGEWYHCYTRGIDGRSTFLDHFDYQRFVQALYLCNNSKPIERSSFWKLTHEKVFELPREKNLVSVGAYALMPNHVHLLLKECEEGGISKFMQRLGTSYTMYFNKRYTHIGNLFVKPFRSKHIMDDSYLRRIVSYIHCNPAEIFEPGWKKGLVRNPKGLQEKLESFRYASLTDYSNSSRPEAALLDWNSINKLLREQMPPLKKLIPDAIEYYQTLS